MNKVIAKKEISLGKIAYNGKSKNCPVTVSLELRAVENAIHWETGDKVNGIELSICGNIWNHIKTDCYSCGQNLDTIAQYIKTPKFKRIRQIWEQYHLNDMNAGTKKQAEAIEKWKAEGNKYEYSQVCEYLKSIGLYEDGFYKYGHAWLFRPIPDEVIAEVKQLFDIS